jgi:hypothetical protein
MDHFGLTPQRGAQVIASTMTVGKNQKLLRSDSRWLLEPIFIRDSPWHV